MFCVNLYYLDYQLEVFAVMYSILYSDERNVLVPPGYDIHRRKKLKLMVWNKYVQLVEREIVFVIILKL